MMSFLVSNRKICKFGSWTGGILKLKYFHKTSVPAFCCSMFDLSSDTVCEIIVLITVAQTATVARNSKCTASGALRLFFVAFFLSDSASQAGYGSRGSHWTYTGSINGNDLASSKERDEMDKLFVIEVDKDTCRY